jgi:KipI family sensor histidine kinase inhibitor
VNEATREPDAVEITWSSERTVRIALTSGKPDDRTRGLLNAWSDAVRAANLPGVRDVVRGYLTLTVLFDPGAPGLADADRRLRMLIGRLSASVAPTQSRQVEIAVCYDTPFAPDLEDVAEHCRLRPSKIVDLHSGASYVVEFLGFAPGFAYLSGLPEELVTPRHSTPRFRVPPGSVAIGGAQTGVYPMAMPGGWRIIGRTPQRLFDVRREQPAMLQPGDCVQFVPIDAIEFEERLRAIDHE